MSGQTCSIGGCEAPHYARTWCKKHCQRWYTNGTTDLLPKPAPIRATCSVADCDRPAKTRGMCGAHAERARAGKPLDSPVARHRAAPFEDSYVKTPSGCWQWTGAVSSEGYGRRSREYAHRHSYELHVGPIPDGLVIDHLCRNTLCVNPEHLEAVTQQVNMLRGVAPAALNVQNERCSRGHRWSPENTYFRRGTGYRICRVCTRERRAAKRGAAA